MCVTQMENKINQSSWIVINSVGGRIVNGIFSSGGGESPQELTPKSWREIWMEMWSEHGDVCDVCNFFNEGEINYPLGKWEASRIFFTIIKKYFANDPLIKHNILKCCLKIYRDIT